MSEAIHGIGENNQQAKLTDNAVMRCRRWYFVSNETLAREDKWTMKEMAELYGVSISTMTNAISGKTWRHVPMPDGHKLPEEAHRNGQWYKDQKKNRQVTKEDLQANEESAVEVDGETVRDPQRRLECAGAEA